MDCLEVCCGSPGRCTSVCPKAPERYVQQLREINGFDLGGVPRINGNYIPLEHNWITLIYHGGSRRAPLEVAIVALRLSDLVNFRTGEVRFQNRDDLCRAFRIGPSADIVLSGVDHDHRVEPWWSLGEHRLEILNRIFALGVRLVTVPNFSLVLDRPRSDDMHSMKRIAIMWAEFEQAGLATALHPNGRTQFDFERWAKFVSGRPEIGILAYEFETGSGTRDRRQLHMGGLELIAREAQHPLDIIVRGSPTVIHDLRKHFRRVIYIDTMPFMKTMMRRRAERTSNIDLDWTIWPTQGPREVDELLAHNALERKLQIEIACYSEA